MKLNNIKNARKVVYRHTQGLNKGFERMLMLCFDKAEPEDKKQLSIAFPQIAQAIRELQWSKDAKSFYKKFVKEGK